MKMNEVEKKVKIGLWRQRIAMVPLILHVI